MLQYRENINYGRMNSSNIDEQLSQLHQLCNKGITDQQLYQAIRQYIFTEIKIEELAVTIVLKDITQIRAYNIKAADIITYMVCNNDQSYKDIADWFGYSKQYIHQTLQHYAAQYNWLHNLMIIKGLQDSKNENNRSIKFNQNRQKKQPLTMWLFTDDDGGAI